MALAISLPSFPVTFTPCQPHWPPCYSSNMSGQHSYLLFPLGTLPDPVMASVLISLKSLLKCHLFIEVSPEHPYFHTIILFSLACLFFFFFLACSEDLSPPDIYFFLTAHTRKKASGEQGLACKYCCGSSTENSACHTVSTQ